jgi:cytochrome oxidase Cu insertion factor (SCO1/SenC/PrrC family)
MTADSAPERDRRPGRGKLAVFLLAAFVLIAILSACGSDNASQSTGTGAQAPAFTLSDQSGQTYNFTPGDGKDHVLVFYMGYF